MKKNTENTNFEIKSTFGLASAKEINRVLAQLDEENKEKARKIYKTNGLTALINFLISLGFAIFLTINKTSAKRARKIAQEEIINYDQGKAQYGKYYTLPEIKYLGIGKTELAAMEAAGAALIKAKKDYEKATDAEKDTKKTAMEAAEKKYKETKEAYNKAITRPSADEDDDDDKKKKKKDKKNK